MSSSWFVSTQRPHAASSSSQAIAATTANLPARAHLAASSSQTRHSPPPHHSHHASHSDASLPPPPPPQRPAPLGRARLSCLPCRRRKSKCDEKSVSGIQSPEAFHSPHRHAAYTSRPSLDAAIAAGTQPCSSCTLRGTEDSCHLPAKPTSTPSKTNIHSASTGSLPVTSPESDAARKRRRVSVQGGQEASSSTTFPLPSQSSDPSSSSSYSSSSDPLAELANLKRSFSRLEQMLSTRFKNASADGETSASPHYDEDDEDGDYQRHSSADPVRVRAVEVAAADPALGQGLFGEDVASCFPCQADCEMLFEYLLQETDWLVNCTVSQWLQPVYNRFVTRQPVTRAEIALLAAAIAVAALLLSEAPQIYYTPSEPPAQIHPTLISYVFAFLEEQAAKSRDYSRGNLDVFVAFGLTLDYLRFSGQRKHHGWPQLRAALRRQIDQMGLLDESNSIWRSFDRLETEIARRVVWHVVVDARWSSIYAEHRGGFPLRRADIKVNYPQWIASRLDGPFRLSSFSMNPRAESDVDLTSPFRKSAQSTPRVFRVKSDHEAEEAAEYSQLAVELSSLAPDVSDYISAIKAWKREQRQRLKSEGDLPSASSGAVALRGGKEREALLHQGVALCEQIKAWRDSIKPRFVEPATLDPLDFYQCRKASQASILHTGVRQLLNAALSAWVTQDLVSDVSSDALIHLQREAFASAKDSVQTIDMTKTLLTCGRTTFFGCFASYSFFSAATTLAIPLLGASKLREEASSAREKLGGLALTDRYTQYRKSSSTSQNGHRASTSSGSSDSNNALAAAATLATVASGAPPRSSHESIAASATDSAPHPLTTGVLNINDLRSLAPDILRIMELLPMFRASPLGKEATQRLASLVETYGIGQGSQEQHQPQHTLSNYARPTPNDEHTYARGGEAHASQHGARAPGPAGGYTVATTSSSVGGAGSGAPSAYAIPYKNQGGFASSFIPPLPAFTSESVAHYDGHVFAPSSGNPLGSASGSSPPAPEEGHRMSAPFGAGAGAPLGSHAHSHTGSHSAALHGNANGNIPGGAPGAGPLLPSTSGSSSSSVPPSAGGPEYSDAPGAGAGSGSGFSSAWPEPDTRGGKGGVLDSLVALDDAWWEQLFSSSSA